MESYRIPDIYGQLWVGLLLSIILLVLTARTENEKILYRMVNATIYYIGVITFASVAETAYSAAAYVLAAGNILMAVRAMAGICVHLWKGYIVPGLKDIKGIKGIKPPERDLTDAYFHRA